MSAATVVCAARGYPEKYPKGMLIQGLDEAGNVENVKVYHAGTTVHQEHDEEVIRCSGGRVLAVTGMGSNLSEALAASYKAVKHISFINDKVDNNGTATGADDLKHYRTDIAKGAIHKKLRIGVLGSTRGTALVPSWRHVPMGHCMSRLWPWLVIRVRHPSSTRVGVWALR